MVVGGNSVATTSWPSGKSTAVPLAVVKRVNTLILNAEIDSAGADRVLETLVLVNTVVNIFDFEDETENAAVQQLMAERTRARQAKDWALADRLRDQLLELGVAPRDEKAEG